MFQHPKTVCVLEIPPQTSTKHRSSKKKIHDTFAWSFSKATFQGKTKNSVEVFLRLKKPQGIQPAVDGSDFRRSPVEVGSFIPLFTEWNTIYIPTGAGFLPSRVSFHFKSATGSTWPLQRNSNSCWSFQLFNSIVTQLDVRFVPGSSTDLSGLWHKGKDFRALQVETYVVSSSQLNLDIIYEYMVIYAITQPQNWGVHKGYWPLCAQPLHSPKLTVCPWK